MKRYVAIDPGKNTAFAVLEGSQLLLSEVYQGDPCTSPTIFLLESFRKDPSLFVVGIEGLSTIYGVAAATNWSLAENVGKWKGILEYLGVEYVELPPKEWQAATTDPPKAPNTKTLGPKEKRKAKADHKKALKMESFRAAQGAFPSARLASHDVADAINMARYLRMQDLEKGNVL